MKEWPWKVAGVCCTALFGMLALQGNFSVRAAPHLDDPTAEYLIRMPIVYNQISTPTPVPETAIIIDHRHTDISQVPVYWIDQAKANLRLSYGHTSHGSQLVTGAAYWQQKNANLAFNTNGAVSSGILSLADYTPSGDLGNPDRSTWASRTRTYLTGPSGTGPTRNVVMWSWCGQAETTNPADIDLYLSLMTQLENDYPGVRFIYMTGHLNTGGSNSTINARNAQIRAHVQGSTNRVLFDFADMESYDPGGTFYANGTDGCVWCSSWCTAHPSDCADLNLMGDCAHSQKLLCKQKAQAFWWLLARLAGWDGV